MSPFTVLALFVQACLIQSVLSQYGCGCSSGLRSVNLARPGVTVGSVSAAGGGGYGGYGGYGGSGEGMVGVEGNVCATGNTLVSGAVPCVGTASFSGTLPASGAVSITGQCGCGCGF